MFRSPLVPFVGAFGAALPSAVSLISLAIAPNSLNREQASWRTTTYYACDLRVSKMVGWLSNNATVVRPVSETLIERGLWRGPEVNLSSATSRERTERLLSDADGARGLVHRLALADIEVKQRLAQYRSHFNPQQPRVPAGSPDGGQWTSTGAGGPGTRLAVADKPRIGPRSLIAITVELAKRMIEAYRSENGLWDLFGHKRGAVTVTTVDGTDIFGSNSGSPTYTASDFAAVVSYEIN
jgi:hypothetical protein